MRQGYSRRHYDRLSNGGQDTPDQIAERVRYRRCAEKAVADREDRYPTLTAENAGEAMEYQSKRLRFHLASQEDHD